MNQIIRLALCVPLCLAVTAARLPGQTADEFAEHLDVLAPALLEASRVPGVAVALIEDGRVTMARGWGVADARTGVPVSSETVFNVGSISKTVTAWAVMRLAEDGRIDLDAPVNHYLERWTLPPSGFDASEVTARRLLSHTAGVSMPAVPDYAPGELVPDIVTALTDSADGPRLVQAPGTAHAYSGGGYGVLQLLVEEVTGQPFAEYVRDVVLDPLGMSASGFEASTTNAPRAAPHDSLGRPIPDQRHAIVAAAGLFSTAADLGRFVAAWVDDPRGGSRGRGVLAPDAVDTLQSPAVELGYGLSYGLGYNLIPLRSGGRSVGHAGSNPGWMATSTAIPSEADGIVVLTNGDGGLGVYKWILCDWVEWKTGAPYAVFCDGREEQPGGTLHGRIGWIDSLAHAVIVPEGPGMAIVVDRAGRIVHRAGYGLADLETRRSVLPTTPFYLASLAKPMTAHAVLQLARADLLDLDAPLGALLPDAPSYAGDLPVRALLTHTSGIPDYYQFIDWPRFRGLNDAGVLDTLRNRSGLDFEPGSRHAYSNSNYVLLARVLETVAQQPFAAVLQTSVLDPAGVRSAIVHDGRRLPVPGRAVGYAGDGVAWRMSDYEQLELPDGTRVTFRMATTGSGGLFASADDVARWMRHLLGGESLGDDWLAQMTEPAVSVEDGAGTGLETGYGLGWYISRDGPRRLIWHDGAKGGFRSAAVYDPAAALSVVVLANGSSTAAREIAFEIAQRLGTGVPSSILLRKGREP